MFQVEIFLDVSAAREPTLLNSGGQADVYLKRIELHRWRNFHQWESFSFEFGRV